ncbi:MAG: 2Fe-2S iron-sulfur cluster-binding protein [Planctomycetota bacterium]
MPEVTFRGEKIRCESGETLRKVLKRAGHSPHNGQSVWFNCKGFGTCGTCAVMIEGDCGPLTFQERARLNFPPHKQSDGLRLSCQVKVENDLRVEKFGGFWGQNVP